MNLELNCANLTDEGKGISIPPEYAKKYPIQVGKKALRKYIEKGGETIDIPLEGGQKEKNTELEQTEK